MRNLKTRLERLEQYQGTKDDDDQWLGPWSQVKIDTIDEWLVAKEIIDVDYQRVKAGEGEDAQSLCSRIMEAVSQSKQISAPGERLAME
ncbi:MAG: hypothetical protein HY881_14445 [Deltaproteobacteria bacterium]|nr:hypothetical protein [Deltaproteobacteria bacterium]